MKNNSTLSRKEEKDLLVNMEKLDKFPGDPMAASRVGYLLRKVGREEEASSYLWTAFRSFVSTAQYSMAVMVADELLSIHSNNVEILHQLSRMADQKDIEIPVLEIYKSYKGFHDLPLFSELGELEFLQLLKISTYHEIKNNKTFIKEGAKGDDIYLIVEGDVRVNKKIKGRKEILLGTLEKGDFLGEIAFVSDKRRSASITTETPCQLLSWKGDDIRKLRRSHPDVAHTLFQAFWQRSLDTILSLSPLFSHFDKDQREKIIKKFKAGAYAPKDAILRQGELNKEEVLYIIKKGEAAVFTDEKGTFKHPKAMLKAGDIFGEYSVLSKEPCTATVMARTILEVITLHRSVFVDIIREDATVADILEKVRKERVDDALLNMSYFQLILEMSEEADDNTGSTD